MQVQEAWRVQVEDRIYVADFDELVEWIKEGAVAPDDLVQKGNLRWLSAGRVPELSVHYFKPTEPAIDRAFAQLERNGELAFEPRLDVKEQDSVEADKKDAAGQATKQYCSKHPNEATAVVCEICHTSFCSRCPHRFGNVKLCPLCGGICANYQDVLNGAPARGALNKPYARKTVDNADRSVDAGKRLGLRDLLRGLASPFSNPADLFVSTLLLSGVFVGLTLAVDGSPLKLVAGVICAVLLIILSFDRLSLIHSRIEKRTHSISFWSRGRSASEGALLRRCGRAFAIYASSFGLFIALLSLAAIFAWNRYSNDMALAESAVQTARDRVTQQMHGSFTNADAIKANTTNNEGSINPSSIVEEVSHVGGLRFERLVMSFMRLSIYYLVPIFVFLIAGLVYLPLAFSTALAAASARKIMNPINSLRHLRQLGFDYILVVVALLSFIVTLVSILWAAYAILPSLMPPELAAGVASLILGVFLAIGWSALSYLLSTSVHRRIGNPAEAAS